jgi:glycosyltransferase involved in cell wall biosynthesis
MTDRHHVVHVIGSLRTGGAERQVVNYLLAADQTEFRHSVVCLTDRGDFAPVVEAAGVPVHVRRVRFRHFPTSLAGFVRWLRHERVHVVHTHMHSAALWGRLAGELAGVPVLVTTEHGKELWKKPHQILVDRWLARSTWRHFAVSRDGMNIRMKRERISADRIELVPNGVPLPDLGDQERANASIRAELGIVAGRPVVGSVGRIVEAKAYPDLLDAVDVVRKRHPDVCWLQIGDGPLRDDLAALVREKRMSDNVIMAGRRENISQLLAALDVWVMSSIREGLPVALLEAMAAARPIVATDVGGIPDAVTDGESALLVPPGDPTLLANGILRLLSDSDTASRLGAAARHRAEVDYSIESVARRIEQTYRSGLAARGVLSA